MASTFGALNAQNLKTLGMMGTLSWSSPSQCNPSVAGNLKTPPLFMELHDIRHLARTKAHSQTKRAAAVMTIRSQGASDESFHPLQMSMRRPGSYSGVQRASSSVHRPNRPRISSTRLSPRGRSHGHKQRCSPGADTYTFMDSGELTKRDELTKSDDVDGEIIDVTPVLPAEKFSVSLSGNGFSGEQVSGPSSPAAKANTGLMPSSEEESADGGSRESGGGRNIGENKSKGWRHRRRPSLHADHAQASVSGSTQESVLEVPHEEGGTPDSTTTSQQDHVIHPSSDDVSSRTSDGGENQSDNEDEDEEVEPGYKMIRVCDRLIEVFWIEKPSADDWKKLLAFSEEWAKIRPHFFKRCEERAREMEAAEPGKAAELFRLGRKMKEMDDSMMQHEELLKLVTENEEEMDGIIARRRKDFTGEFFEYVHTRCEACYKDFKKQEEMVKLASKILNSVHLHDSMMQNEEAVEVAQAKFDDIMNSASLEEACGKIDSLAERQQLDSTLMLMITKAWAAAKESNMMKDEVRDVMWHLYQQALVNMRMLVPKEVRILRHILSLEDPREMLAALTAAFSPGDEYEVQNASEDVLYTTPDKLLEVVDQVLTAYYSNRETTLIEEAKKLMNPAVIKQLEILKQIIIDEFK